MNTLIGKLARGVNPAYVAGITMMVMMLPLLAVGAAGSVIQPNLPTNCGDFVRKIENIGQSLASVIFALSILVLLYSAFLFITTSGNEEGVKNARTWLIYALVGLAVALFAFVLPNIVESVLGGSRGNCT